MERANFLMRKAFAQKTGLVQQPDGRIFTKDDDFTYEFSPETSGGDELRLVVALDIPNPVCDEHGVKIGDFYEVYQSHGMSYHSALMAATIKFAASLAVE